LGIIRPVRLSYLGAESQTPRCFVTPQVEGDETLRVNLERAVDGAGNALETCVLHAWRPAPQAGATPRFHM
jgi:hypothetical protein